MQDYDVVFCDSCLGGSTVAAALARSHRGVRAFYLADYAVNPLGTKSDREVGAALRHWHEVARSRADRMIIACNTASVRHAEAGNVADGRADRSLRVWSMVDLVEALIASERERVRGKRVALMGTRFTVSHAVYRDALERAGAGTIVPLAATRTEHVVALLRHNTTAGREEIAREIAPVIEASDAVLLACTCFPLAADVIRRLNPRCALLDPATAVGCVMPGTGRARPNRLTLALSGQVVTAAQARAHAGVLFPGWVVDEILAADDECSVTLPGGQ